MSLAAPQTIAVIGAGLSWVQALLPAFDSELSVP